MAPLGFCEVRGTAPIQGFRRRIASIRNSGKRLSERRRILYRVIFRKTGIFEVVYESSEDRFDILLSEAQAVASSLELLPSRRPHEVPPAVGHARNAG